MVGRLSAHVSLTSEHTFTFGKPLPQVSCFDAHLEMNHFYLLHSATKRPCFEVQQHYNLASKVVPFFAGPILCSISVTVNFSHQARLSVYYFSQNFRLSWLHQGPILYYSHNQNLANGPSQMKSYGCWPIISYLGFSRLLQDPILYIGLKRNTLQMHTGGKRTLFEFRVKRVKKKEGMVSLSVYNTTQGEKNGGV